MEAIILGLQIQYKQENFYNHQDEATWFMIISMTMSTM